MKRKVCAIYSIMYTFYAYNMMLGLKDERLYESSLLTLPISPSVMKSFAIRQLDAISLRARQQYTLNKTRKGNERKGRGVGEKAGFRRCRS